MNAMLNQVIASLNLQPGQSFRTQVNGHEVEVRMLDAARSPPPVEEPSQFADMVMLEPWFEMPEMPGTTVMTVQRGEPQLPPPMEFDESDLAPE